jgi:hypothetical protein
MRSVAPSTNSISTRRARARGSAVESRAALGDDLGATARGAGDGSVGSVSSSSVALHHDRREPIAYGSGTSTSFEARAAPRRARRWGWPGCDAHAHAGDVRPEIVLARSAIARSIGPWL